METKKKRFRKRKTIKKRIVKGGKENDSDETYQYIYENGDVYIGQWKNGNRNGEGKMNYRNGDIYEGQWKNGNIQGKGKMIYENGNVYEGEWKNGNMQGQGKMVYNNRDVYEGEWKNGNMQGEGKMIYKNGDVYKGQWKVNEKNGNGKLIQISISNSILFTYDGEWKNDYINGQGKIKYNKYGHEFSVIGKWILHKKGEGTGKGKMVYENGKGNIYIGHWEWYWYKNDEYSYNYTNGKMIYKNGDVYEGDWKFCNKHGNGKMIYKNGNIYEGHWNENKKDGKGKMTYSNGDIIYEGDWKNDYPDSKYNIDEKLTNKWLFTENIEKYKKSPSYFYNGNPYIINYEMILHREYPVIIIPKGTILYTASFHKNNRKQDEEFLYNLHNLHQSIEDDLKFFYPLPYSEKGVNDYDTCNIVILNHDIKILALLSPAPHSRRLKYPIGNAINEEGFSYYNDDFIHTCKNGYDLCIKNKKIMKEKNIQGYITLAKNDTLSHGTRWNEILTEYKDYNIEYKTIERLLYLSLMASYEDILNNKDIVSSNYPNQYFDTDRIYGIPEIVLSPVNTNFFYTNYKKENIIINRDIDIYNYKKLNIVDIDEVKDYLDNISHNIISNQQSPVFHIYKPDMNNYYKYYDGKIKKNDEILIEDVDYIHSYENPNSSNICAFETIAYNKLKTKVTGGDSNIIQRKIDVKDSNINLYKKKKIINEKNTDENPPIFEMTKNNIPIAFF